MRRRRSGSTLIDLIVVLAIAGVMLAILLPTVLRSRGQARNADCANKMKQLGLALQNHHDVYKRFPGVSNQGLAQGVASVWWPDPGSGATTGETPSVGYTSGAGDKTATAGYSWIVKILPYLDEGPLFNSIAQASNKFTVDAFTPSDVEGAGSGASFSVTINLGGQAQRKHFAAVELTEVQCPDYTGSATVAPSFYHGDPPGNPPAAYGHPNGSDKLGSPSARAAITNYVALPATHFSCLRYATVKKLAETTEIPADAEAPNGVIVPGVGLNMKAVTDGTSRTVMLCETIEPAMNCWYDGTTSWTTGINPNSIAKHPPTKDGAANPQHFWLVPEGGSSALNVGPVPIKTVAYCPALEGYCATPRVISWGPSSHAGEVVNHVAVDGSVHAFTTDIDPTVYMHLITRAGREPDAFPDTFQ